MGGRVTFAEAELFRDEDFIFFLEVTHDAQNESFEDFTDGRKEGDGAIV